MVDGQRSYTISQGAKSRLGWYERTREGVQIALRPVSGRLRASYFNGWIFALSAGLQLLDAATTAAGWSAGLPETNPRMSSLLENGGLTHYLVVKISAGLICAAGLAVVAARAKWAYLAAMALAGFMAGVVATNFVSLGWV